MLSVTHTVTIGDRVYYRHTGPHDTGTIIDIIPDDVPFVVKWDNSDEIDSFKASQLGWIGEASNPPNNKHN